MMSHLRANLWLLSLTLFLCSVLYPAVLWVIGQSVFPKQAEGSLLRDASGKVIGSRLIAQPFTDKDGNVKDEYFQPRPSAVSYKADASGASNWGASNYQLRDRVARALGPIVKYGKDSPNTGRLVGPDVERWFQKDQYQGKPGIVAQWAETHPTLAQSWVKADKANAAYVAEWQKQHSAEVADWVKDNLATLEPKPEDLAVPFFVSYSKDHPGTWPKQVDVKTPTGQTEKRMEPIKEDSDIQSYFFDMWRQENPKESLEEVPADLVMASASGLDPHVTLDNALYQLDRVATKWVALTKRDPAEVRRTIKGLLEKQAESPLGGLVGVPLVNVLEMNLALRERFGSAGGAK
jgi:K+-transporting ATPase ATPase C chain